MNIIISSIDKILNFGKTNSLQALVFGTSCCAEELQQGAYSDFEQENSTHPVFTTNPKQADLLICTGTLTVESASHLLNLYNQMPKPAYVIAMGSCACSGGMFSDSYTAIQGIDKVLPVDIYLPGCPPKAEALFEALQKLKEDIKSESFIKKKEGQKACGKPVFDDTKDVESLNREHFGTTKP